MNRIDKKFIELKEINKKALITFVTAGHPSIKKTKELILIKEEAGADIIEVGIPFSDPLADGPIIQKASTMALKNGLKVKDVFKMIAEVRKESDVPLLFLVYFNIIFNYGIESFVSECKKVGIDGLIVPDLPYEEETELTEFLDDSLCLIPLVSPISKDRIKKIVSNKKGFVYCITSLGTTGQEDGFHENTEEYLKEIRKITKLPLAIGFGIKSTKQVKPFLSSIDGYIIGSTIVQSIDDNQNDLEAVKKLVTSLVL